MDAATIDGAESNLCKKFVKFFGFLSMEILSKENSTI